MFKSKVTKVSSMEWSKVVKAFLKVSPKVDSKLVKEHILVDNIDQSMVEHIKDKKDILELNNKGWVAMDNSNMAFQDIIKLSQAQARSKS